MARLGPIIAGQSPELRFSTFLGGPKTGQLAGNDALSVAVDRKLATYVAGITASQQFPTRKADQKRGRGGLESFVTKIKK